MNVGIIGSRSFYNSRDIFVIHDWMAKNLDDSDTVITGGAPGADEIARAKAQDLGIRVIVIPVPPPRRFPGESFGRRAFIRNTWIVNESSYIVAFWDGVSKGTAMTMEIANKAGKTVKVIGRSLHG